MAKRVFVNELKAFPGKQCDECGEEFANLEPLYVYDENGLKFCYCRGCHRKSQDG
jgi:formylmethanofuran dehydrogenase subunit E